MPSRSRLSTGAAGTNKPTSSSTREMARSSAWPWLGSVTPSAPFKMVRSPRAPGRPWAAAFDRAQARSPKAGTSRDVFGDWIADEIWSLKWAEDYDFALARQELATRLTIAEDICARLREGGARADRAAAEAVMMVEVVGESDFWTEVKDCNAPLMTEGRARQRSACPPDWATFARGVQGPAQV